METVLGDVNDLASFWISCVGLNACPGSHTLIIKEPIHYHLAPSCYPLHKYKIANDENASLNSVFAVLRRTCPERTNRPNTRCKTP